MGFRGFWFGQVPIGAAGASRYFLNLDTRGGETNDPGTEERTRDARGARAREDRATPFRGPYTIAEYEERE